MTMENYGIDHPGAIGAAAPEIHRMNKAHKDMAERMDAIAINAGDRLGLRTRYQVKLEALVRAVNDLGHFQHEVANRFLDLSDAAAKEAVRELLDPSNNRFPADDEQH